LQSQANSRLIFTAHKRGTAIVENGPETIDVLVRGRYLPADREAFTRAEIGEALTRMVASERG
jgi:hypothetical protein